MGKRYTVLSSSTEENTKMGEIPLCQIADAPLKVFQGKEGLLVIRNGKAGATIFLDKGSYTINDHAYILFLKDNCHFKLSLKWLSFQYKHTFLEYSSSSDNGTWNMTGFFDNVLIDIPDYAEQIEITKLYDRLDTQEKKLNSIIERINAIFDKTIVNA